jgi:hypothetical protein
LSFFIGGLYALKRAGVSRRAQSSVSRPRPGIGSVVVYAQAPVPALASILKTELDD